MKRREILLPRVATPDEATLLVGDLVPDREPNVKGPTVVRDAATGDLVAAYLPLTDVGRLRRALPEMHFGGVQRSSNYRSKSQTFGFAPRRPVRRREMCAATSTTLKLPHVQRELDRVADQCARLLEEVDPDVVRSSRDEVDDVLPEWKMGESGLWTSGVVNDTAQLPYHRDAFNYPVWSAMPVLRRGTSGGYLHIPEYDLVLPCQDSYAVFFKGKDLVHGVTPITKRTEDGYRYSVVYYALRGMKDCYTHAVETAYGQRKRTERERDIARRVARGELGIPGQERRRLAPEEADSSAEALDAATGKDDLE